MHYAYEVTILPTHVASSPLIFPIILGAGILRKASFYFPAGCSGTTCCVLRDSSVQIAPTNPDGLYALNDDVAVADLYHNLYLKNNKLYVIGWSRSGSYQHVVSVHLEVQGPEEPDPYKIMRIMSDTTNRLIDLLRASL